MQIEKLSDHQKNSVKLKDQEHKTWRIFARWLSCLFSPPLLISIIVLIVSADTGWNSAWFWSVFLIFVGVLLPIFYLQVQVRRGLLPNLGLYDRQSRIRPLLLVLSSLLLGWFIMWARSAPLNLIFLTGSGVLTIAIFLLITLQWKISGHTTAAAYFAVILVGLMGNQYMPLFAMPLFVAWSRVFLKRHSLSQTIGGIMLGSCSALLFLLLQ